MSKIQKAAQVVRLNAPATSSATAITADFGGEVAKIDPVDLGVTITQPDIPRNVFATFGAGWSATNHVTIYGTDANDAPISETLTANPGSTRTGAKAFKSIAKITKVAQDAAAGTNLCSIGSGVVFGVAGQLADSFGSGHLVGTGFDPLTVSTANNTIAPATAPNGVRVWHCLVNLQAV